MDPYNCILAPFTFSMRSNFTRSTYTGNLVAEQEDILNGLQTHMYNISKVPYMMSPVILVYRINGPILLFPL